MEFNVFESIKIGLASPEQIRAWSHGEVKRPETINYRTLKPENEGLFCERIFGPTKDWECHCGRYKRLRFKGKVCEKCGVEVTRSAVRRERMGHIELAAPVSHVWYFRGIPSRMGLILDISPRRLEEVLYFGKYIVVDPGHTGLDKGQLLSEKEYSEWREKYEDDFEAGMGAEAIKDLLATVGLTNEESVRKLELMRRARALEQELRGFPRHPDEEQAALKEEKETELAALKAEIDSFNGLEPLSAELKQQLNDATGQKKIRILKRLECVEAFRLSGNKPEWMVLDALPVIPPDIRPMVQLDGGRFATSDLNDLYRRVINRNNRLQHLLELKAPDIIVRNEKRMLQEAVDALIDNGRRGRPVTGPNNRPLKSLSDMLKGKQGRFRQNLLGKRVDYSGRSVIVVGPELKMYQCGLPKEMALELFKPFVMKRLVETGAANNIRSARKMVDRARPEVWDALEIVIKDHPVLLNRAPTLHRLGIQAFEPVLVEGRALKLHPLVCTAFNADFDGDQMAVHVPLSAEAQAEARFLMLAANNLLKPSDGRPVVVPTQDMVLGSYYLTLVKDGEPGEGKVFRDVSEALMAYQEGIVTLHAKIKVRMTKGSQSRIIDTTVGRLIFNDPVPQNLGFVDRSKPENQFELEVSFLVTKKTLGKIIDRCIKIHGTAKTSEVLDRIKAQGYKYSTRSGITVAVCDATVPEEKKEIIAEAEKANLKVVRQYERGLITAEERTNHVINIWNNATDRVTEAFQKNLDKFNPIYMMADSGARGSINNLRQLAGMRGLIANTSGTTIEMPIKANYREGLNILEYFISSRGARKGLADTALRTADSGYLTRRLVDVSQDVIIRQNDCGTDNGIWVYDIREGNEMIESLSERLQGRYLVEDFCDPKTGEVLVSKDKIMDDKDAEKICATGVEKVKIRSILTCRSTQGICAHCYGANLANGKPVAVGESVGVIAAQSIGEPGTQLTMRTFHTGGIANAEDITQGLPRVAELFEARKPKNSAILTEVPGIVAFDEEKHQRVIVIHNEIEERRYPIPYGFKIKVQEGQTVAIGDSLTEGAINPHDLLAVKGVDINDKHIEVIVRQMMKKVRIVSPGSTELLSGSIMDRGDIYQENRRLEERAAAGEEGIQLITFEPVLLGITKAALATDSFLSAASFQETTKVLTEAAIKGKVDHLVGLKENVIIGKPIPAGTGMPCYNDVQVVPVKQEIEPVELL